MNCYFDVWRNYANFEGRARRAEYWMWILFHFLAIFLLVFVDAAIVAGTGDQAPAFLTGLYLLAAFIPSWAVFVRRMHDTGRSGWYFLVFLIPFVGWLILLLALVENSKRGRNEYGPNPKGYGNRRDDYDRDLRVDDDYDRRWDDGRGRRHRDYDDRDRRDREYDDRDRRRDDDRLRRDDY